MTVAPRARPLAGARAALAIAAVGAAALLRTAAGGTAPAGSAPAALLFCALLAGVVVVARWRAAAPSWSTLGVGAAAAMALVALSLLGLPAVTVGARASAAELAWWVPLVVAVAALEELVLRGVVFDAVTRSQGTWAAVTVTSALFAVIHAPLYGVQALPLDLCVGVLLGCLRVLTGSVWAPLSTHVLADLATGWVG